MPAHVLPDKRSARRVCVSVPLSILCPVLAAAPKYGGKLGEACMEAYSNGLYRGMYPLFISPAKFQLAWPVVYTKKCGGWTAKPPYLSYRWY